MNGLRRKLGVGSNAIGSVILFLLFVLILLVSLDSVFQGYRTLHCANLKVQQTIDEAVQQVRRNAAGATGDQLTASSELFLRCLDGSGRGALDANAIAFLFQLFSLCLVSTGVYLVDRAHRNARAAEHKVSLIRSLMADNQAGLTFAGYLLSAHQASSLLRSASETDERIGHAATLRDILTLLDGALMEGIKGDVAISPAIQHQLLELCRLVRSNLDQAGAARGGEGAPMYRDLLEAVKRSEQTLAQPRFGKLYDTRSKLLEGD